MRAEVPASSSIRQNGRTDRSLSEDANGSGEAEACRWRQYDLMGLPTSSFQAYGRVLEKCWARRRHG